MAAQGPFWAQITYTFSFHSRTGNNEPIHIPKNTEHDLFGLKIAENALNFHILAIYGSSRSILSSNYPYIFSFHGGTGNNETIHIPKEHEPLASGLWLENALNFDIFAIYGRSRTFLGDDACSFKFEIISGNNYDSNMAISTFHDIFGPVPAWFWPGNFQNING